MREGGRVQEIAVAGEALELGASIFWEFNTYIKQAAEVLGLQLQVRGGSSPPHPSQKGEQGALPDRAADGEGAGQQATESDLASLAGGERSGDGGDGEGLAVFDGQAFVLNMTGSWQDFTAAAIRYGPAAVRYTALVADAFRRFRRVYDRQAAGVSYGTPEALLHDLGLYNETQQSCSDYLQSWLVRPWWLWGGGYFAEEVVGAINRCNYNQRNAELNALAGLVSYGPAAYGKVWSIVGGNRQLVSGLLAVSGATVMTNSRVSLVRQLDDGRYVVEVRAPEAHRAAGSEPPWPGAEDGNCSEQDAEEKPDDGPAVEYGPYDAVVVATPLLNAGITLSLGGEACHVGLPRGKDTDAQGGRTPQGATANTWCQAANLDRPYQVTVTTWVAGGRLRPSYFGVRQLPAVRAVLVTDSAEVPFSSIASRRVGPGNSSQLVYKVFSQQVLSRELLSHMFEPGPGGQPPRVLACARWHAYPRYKPPERFSPFALAPGLLYGNALEAAASAMEMAAVAGRNSALLALQHLRARRRAAAEAAEAEAEAEL